MVCTKNGPNQSFLQQIPFFATVKSGSGAGGWGAGQGGGAGGEEALPAIGASPVRADSRERVPTPRVSTTRIGMQEHRLD